MEALQSQQPSAQFRLTNYNTCGVQYYDFNFYPLQYNQPNYYRVAQILQQMN